MSIALCNAYLAHADACTGAYHRKLCEIAVCAYGEENEFLMNKHDYNECLHRVP